VGSLSLSQEKSHSHQHPADKSGFLKHSSTQTNPPNTPADHRPFNIRRGEQTAKKSMSLFLGYSAQSCQVLIQKNRTSF
jgi:hypothetical protein